MLTLYTYLRAYHLPHLCRLFFYCVTDDLNGVIIAQSYIALSMTLYQINVHILYQKKATAALLPFCELCQGA